MSRIKGRDTKLERKLRSCLHKAGLRFRVCRTDLPGRPDIVFPRQKLAIQVRGCFWHQHHNCSGGRTPGSNQSYWAPKLQRNAQRDAEKDVELIGLGWQVLVIWECEMRAPSDVEKITGKVASRIGKKVEIPESS
ncbi:very short patch repair endonuclease [Rhizobium sp. NZLR1]|nr:very short patch repair endonuclease [Rhizobium sp. NZLR1]